MKKLLAQRETFHKVKSCRQGHTKIELISQDKRQGQNFPSITPNGFKKSEKLTKEIPYFEQSETPFERYRDNYIYKLNTLIQTLVDSSNAYYSKVYQKGN